MLANETAGFLPEERLRTLGDVEVISWVAVERCERGVHVDAMLRKGTDRSAGLRL